MWAERRIVAQRTHKNGIDRSIIENDTNFHKSIQESENMMIEACNHSGQNTPLFGPKSDMFHFFIRAIWFSAREKLIGLRKATLLFVTS